MGLGLNEVLIHLDLSAQFRVPRSRAKSREIYMWVCECTYARICMNFYDNEAQNFRLGKP